MSLDGVVGSPQDWHFPYMNEEVMGAIAEGMKADTIVLGRRTYEEWAGFWPERPSDGGMADYINGTPKLSPRRRSTDRLGEREPDRGRRAGALTELKKRDGGNISITGSGTLVQSLLEAGLIDELRLLVHPIVVGRGSVCSRAARSHRASSSPSPRRLAPASST